MKKGCLYICSAHLGNLDDMTYQTVEVLKKVHIICAEDTREFKKIAEKYKITTNVISYHVFNEHDKLSYVLKILNDGLDVAIIPDRGTPVVNDPGFLLIREYRNVDDYRMSILPGPSAALCAFVISGLSHRFLFLGFLTNYSELKSFIDFKYSLVIFESPRRIGRFLKECYDILGDRLICVCREITKKHEQIIHCKLSQIPDFEHKGEITVVIGPK